MQVKVTTRERNKNTWCGLLVVSAHRNKHREHANMQVTVTTREKAKIPGFLVVSAHR